MSSLLNSVSNAAAGLANLKNGGYNNPVSKAISNSALGRLEKKFSSSKIPGLLNNLQSIFGTPQVGQAAYQNGRIASNVQGFDTSSPVSHFLQTMDNWVAAIPLRTQFMVIIDTIPNQISSTLLRRLEGADVYNNNFDNTITELKTNDLQKTYGCMFITGASIPSENLGTGTAAIENNSGFKQGGVLQGRDAFASNNLTLQFRETNTSFTDFVMRPWLIAAAHAGYVARNANDPLNVKCNIYIYELGKTFAEYPMVNRKVWKFYDCVPLNLGTRNLSYDAESIEQYDVSFIYDDYTVDSFIPFIIH